MLKLWAYALGFLISNTITGHGSPSLFQSIGKSLLSLSSHSAVGSEGLNAQFRARLEEQYKNDNHSLAILGERYKGKVVRCKIPEFPQCDIYLLGTMHVAKRSSEMVNETINALRPHFTIIELCDARLDLLIDSVYEEEMMQNVTLRSIIKSSLKGKSLMLFGTGLLTWMQQKASRATGSKLGNELYVAAKEAYKSQSGVILGDRLYPVTIQRCFDKLNVTEKIKLVIMLLFEVLSMTVNSIKDYIKKSEGDGDFLNKEMERFERHLPSFAKVIIHERDEYLAQTIYEVAKTGFGDYRFRNEDQHLDLALRGKICVVVGAAHLKGIEKWLSCNGSTHDRMLEISTSSKDTDSTWPGSGKFCSANVEAIFGGSST